MHISRTMVSGLVLNPLTRGRSRVSLPVAGAVRVADCLRLTLICFLFCGCSPVSAEDDPELVSGLRFEPGAFDSFRTSTEIRYQLKSPATVDLFVTSRDSLGDERLVKTLVRRLAESRGSHVHAWLGDTDQMIFAPAGSYRGVLVAGRQRFEAFVIIYHPQ